MKRYAPACEACGAVHDYMTILQANDEPEDEPQEPDDEDVTASDPAGPFYYLGKRIADNRAELRAWMKAQGYGPNVWFISDHGNAHLITDIGDSSQD